MTNDLGVDPSHVELTREIVEYADELDSCREIFDVCIPYVAEAEATSRFAKRAKWFLLYLEHERLGRLECGYAYEEAKLFVPFTVGVTRSLFDERGKKIGGYSGNLLGLYFPYPGFSVLGFSVEVAEDARARGSHLDVGLDILKPPGLKTSFLFLSTRGIQFFFVPLWEKDRSPRQ